MCKSSQRFRQTHRTVFLQRSFFLPQPIPQTSSLFAGVYSREKCIISACSGFPDHPCNFLWVEACLERVAQMQWFLVIRGISSTSSLGCQWVGVGGLRRKAGHRKIVVGLHLLSYNQYIITKFPSRVFIYTHKNLVGWGGSGGRHITGAMTSLPLVITWLGNRVYTLSLMASIYLKHPF